MQGNRRRRLTGAAALVMAILGSFLITTPSAYALVAPGSLSVDEPVSGSPVLSWARVSGATSYALEYSTDPDFATGVTKVSTVNRRYVPTKRLPAATIWWRVQAKASGSTSEWRTSSFLHDPKAGPALLTPANASTLDQPEDPVLLSWDAVSGAATYTVEIDDSPDFLTPTVKPGLKTTAFIVDNPQVATTYYWHVKAIFDGGVETTYSETWSYQIGGLDKPALVSPPNDPTNAVQDVVLEWQPVLGAHHYELQVSTADSFTPIIDSKPSITGTTYSPATTYANDQYYWRVRPVDPFGNKLAWEQVDVWEFKRSWPDQPTLEYPINNDIVGDVFYYQWTPVPLASRYTLQIDDNISFSSPSTCSTVHTTYVPKSGSDCWPGAVGTFYWRVFVSDEPKNVGTEQDHAEIQSFSYLPAFVNMQTATPGDGTSVTVPTFSWQPVAGAEKYRVYLEAVTPGAAGTFPAGRITNTTSLTPTTALTEGATYRWFVQTISASGRNGGGLVAEAWSTFTVQASSTTNTALTLTSPANAAQFNRFPKLTWAAVQDASYYRVYVRNADGIAAFEPLGGGDGTKFPYPAGEDVNATNLPQNVEWMVRAFDASDVQIAQSSSSVFGIVGLGDVTGFRVANTGLASESGGTSCTATLPTRCENMRQTPVFRWDPVPNAGGYRLWISRDPTYTNVVAGYDGIFVDGNAFMPTAALPDSQAEDAYHWEVVACTVDSACGGRDDATHAVNKRSNPVELLTPGDGTTGPNTVTFTWRDYLATNLDVAAGHVDATGINARIEAEQYKVEVSTVPNFQSTIDTATVDQKTYTAYTKLYPEGILYWRVAAVDATGNTLTFSSPRTFTKATAAPLLHELNSGAPVTQTVPFSWAPATYAASYQVEIYKNNDTVPSQVNKVGATISSKQSAMTLSSPLPPSAQPYRWRVRKVDASGNVGPWTSLTDPKADFTVVAQAPTQTAPPGGVKIAGNDGYFAWTAVSGAKAYRFQRRLAGETSLAENVTTVAQAWAPTAAVPDGSWQWRVVALDAANGEIGVSPWRGFSVDSTRPYVVSHTPAAGASVRPRVNFFAKFSEPVINVNATTIKLVRRGGGAVAAKVTLSADKRTAKLNPNANLRRGKTYILRVTSRVKDLSGLQAVPKSWKVVVKR